MLDDYSKRIQFYTEEIPELLLKYIEMVNWKTYLDLGCGDGSLLYALNKKGYFNNKIVYAIDLSEKRINFVKKINKEFICFIDDACNLQNIKDNSVDFLVSTQLIEHVPDDKDMIKEINRVLNKNGIVYLSTVFKKWYGWYFYRCNDKWTLDPTHMREYTQDNQLFDFFGEYDLEVIENKKTLVWRPLIDFVFRRVIFRIISPKRNVFENRFLRIVRNIKLPILGYYCWEIICRKK
jgi:2-polyprenyl-3-methyl-5-hydroxy-6-metoxy-1,4-benzoquinol methylase